MFFVLSTDEYSVIALSKLYNLGDPRLDSIMVKGDLIIPKSDRIMTRSRARQSKPKSGNSTIDMQSSNFPRPRSVHHRPRASQNHQGAGRGAPFGQREHEGTRGGGIGGVGRRRQR